MADHLDISELLNIVDGYQKTRILFSAIDLGIFEKINAKPINAEEVAVECGSDPLFTETILNSLVSMNLLDKNSNIYKNSDATDQYLLKSSNSYIGDIVLFTGNSWDAWQELTASIKEGIPKSKPYIEKQHDKDWEYFIKGMHNFALSRGDAETTTRLIDLSKNNNLLDVACGPGTYSFELAKKYSNLNIILFDLPNTINITRDIGTEYLFSERIKYVEGDYNVDDFPSSYDCALLFNIIHQENEDNNLILIRKIYDGLEQDGTLIIKDHLLNENKTLPVDGALFSVQMRLTNGGRCYSENEVRSWMSDVGFRDITKIDPEAPMTSAFMTGIK